MAGPPFAPDLSDREIQNNEDKKRVLFYGGGPIFLEDKKKLEPQRYEEKGTQLSISFPSVREEIRKNFFLLLPLFPILRRLQFLFLPLSCFPLEHQQEEQQ